MSVIFSPLRVVYSLPCNPFPLFICILLCVYPYDLEGEMQDVHDWEEQIEMNILFTEIYLGKIALYSQKIEICRPLQFFII